MGNEPDAVHVGMVRDVLNRLIVDLAKLHVLTVLAKTNGESWMANPDVKDRIVPRLHEYVKSFTSIVADLEVLINGGR